MPPVVVLPPIVAMPPVAVLPPPSPVGSAFRRYRECPSGDSEIALRLEVPRKRFAQLDALERPYHVPWKLEV